jgi:hypothetical protein
MEKISFSDVIGVGGIVLATVLLVLDKAGKLKGGWLFALLCLAGAMTLFIALGNSWVIDAPGSWKLWRAGLMVSLVAFTYSGLAIWISAPSGEITKSQNAPQPQPVPEVKQEPQAKPHPKAPLRYKPEEVYAGGWGKHESGDALLLTDKPIVLETQLVNQQKVFTLKNLGFQFVDDLGVSLSRYKFAPNDFIHGKLTLEKWEKFGGGGFPRKVLAGHSESEPLTFGIMPGFEDVPNGEIHFDSPVMTTYFCIRVTFRNPRTGKKYVIYRVTSAAKNGFPFLPEDLQPWDSRQEIKNLHFMKEIAPTIIQHQDEELDDGAERYKP